SSTRRAKSNTHPSSSRRGGAQRRGGGVQSPQDHLSATPSRPALLHEEGKVNQLSPPRRGGVARSAGVAGFQVRRRTTCPRHRRVLPSSTRRARSTNSPLLVEEGWREATGWSGFRFAAGPPVRDTVASCPPPRGGQGQPTFPSSSRRGGAKRR